MANMFGDIMQNGSPLAADPSSGYYQGPDGTWYYQGQPVAGSGPGSASQPQLPASVQMAAAPGSVTNPLTGATAPNASAPSGGNVFTPSPGFVNTSPVKPSSPTGVADPKNPGYDTGGFVMGSTGTFGTGESIPNPTTGRTTTVGANLSTISSAPTGSGLPSGPATIPPFSGVNYPGFTPPPLPESLQKPFSLPSASDLIANDPGYMARYNQGQQGLERSAAAQGTLLSGGQLKAAENYGQDYASNEYNNYVNQLLSQRNQQTNDYLTLAYGPAWQQNQAGVNQYGTLYGQYKDLIANNRNASQDYINALLEQQRIGAGAAAPPPTSSTSNV
jgi:hypothetical protein